MATEATKDVVTWLPDNLKFFKDNKKLSFSNPHRTSSILVKSLLAVQLSRSKTRLNLVHHKTFTRL